MSLKKRLKSFLGKEEKQEPSLEDGQPSAIVEYEDGTTKIVPIKE